jgi:hypothetical protein
MGGFAADREGDGLEEFVGNNGEIQWKQVPRMMKLAGQKEETTGMLTMIFRDPYVFFFSSVSSLVRFRTAHWLRSFPVLHPFTTSNETLYYLGPSPLHGSARHIISRLYDL